MKKYNGYVIKNIHTNTRHPGIIYAEVYDGSGLILSATLELCVERVKKYIGAMDHTDTIKDEISDDSFEEAFLNRMGG